MRVGKTPFEFATDLLPLDLASRQELHSLSRSNLHPIESCPQISPQPGHSCRCVDASAFTVALSQASRGLRRHTGPRQHETLGPKGIRIAWALPAHPEVFVSAFAGSQVGAGRPSFLRPCGRRRNLEAFTSFSGDLSLRATCPGCRLYGHVERLRRAIQDPPLELRAMWSDPGPMLLVV